MTPPAPALTGRRLAGYRVLRSLGRDSDTEVLLGFREDAAAGSAVTVVLRTTSATAQNWQRLAATVGALERASGPHVVELLDLEADDETLTAVFERLPRGSLSELLVLRTALDAGEAVTLLAPIVQAMMRMHGAGVAHGAITTRSILFRDDGAPVLIGFGTAHLFAAGAPEVALEREAGVLADRVAMRALATAVLGRVSGARARAARVMLEQLEGAADDLVLPVLAAGIFEVAAAVPIRFTADDPKHGAGEPTRVVPLGAPVPGEERAGRHPPLLDRLARRVPETWAQRVMDAVEGSPAAPVISGAMSTVRRRWNGLSPGRRRALLGVAVGVAVLTAALALVPNGSVGSAGVAPSGARRSAEATRPALSGAEVAAGAGSESPANAETALLGDDPLAAARVLAAARDRCVRAVSLLCLDGVEEPDSGALRDDREAIRLAQQGGETPDPLVGTGTALAPVLVERLGGSALVRLAAGGPAGLDTEPGEPALPPTEAREPASLLLVRGEAGWRIRDVIAAQGESG